MTDLAIEYVYIETLKPSSRNARTHSKKQIHQIATSIEEFGFNSPVLVDKDNRIIAGHGRVAAMKLLKRSIVPIVRIEHLTDEQIRAYALADNRLAEKAGWDQEMLKLELGELLELDLAFDIEITGFETAEIDNLLDVAPASAKDPADNGGMGSFYRSQHELVFVWKVGSAPHVNTIELGKHGRYRTNVWSYAGVNTIKKRRNEELAMHPTVKPVALVADAIKDASRRGDNVLDPFGGSGTTLIAAERTKRRARLIEIDEHYCDVSIHRWESFTGERAERLVALGDRSGRGPRLTTEEIGDLALL